jgi:hypothetical protein
MAEDKRVVVLLADNAAKTLEQPYAQRPAAVVNQVILDDDVSQDDTAEIGVPTRCFRETSLVNFTNSVVYGQGTRWVVGRYLLDRCGLHPSTTRRKTLPEVISRYLVAQINQSASVDRERAGRLAAIPAG